MDMLVAILTAVLLAVAAIVLIVQLVDFFRHKAKKEHAPVVPLVFAEALIWFLATFGVSDCAVNMVVYRGLHVADTRRLPGTMIVGAIVPLAVMSASYLNSVNFSGKTLIILILAQAVGGFVGASLVRKLNINVIRIVMSLALLATALILIARTCIFHVEGGDAIGLEGVRLAAAAILLCATQALTMLGFGNTTPNICILLALGMGPLAVYPIVMTANTAGCLIGCMRFIRDGLYVRTVSLIEATAGLIGVFLAMKLVTGMNSNILQLMMIALMLYSSVSLLREYVRERKRS